MYKREQRGWEGTTLESLRKKPGKREKIDRNEDIPRTGRSNGSHDRSYDYVIVKCLNMDVGSFKGI